jgi:hypothetical protein
MATVDQIPTDLTLEIGEAVSPDKFLVLAKAFFGYVEEVAATVTGDGDPVTWAVLVREGSGLIGVQPMPVLPDMMFLQDIYAKAEFGIQQLAYGLLEESELSEPALKHLRTMSSAMEARKGHALRIRVWVKRKPVELSPQIARVIEEDWRIGYHDFGTVEGRLESIQDNDGRLQLRVRDAALRQAVICNVPDDMLQDTFAKFRRRVEVTGMINYRRNGTPVSINVAHIEAMPEDNELPSADEVRGLLKVVDAGRTDILG